jgi:hypothetical protein
MLAAAHATTHTHDKEALLLVVDTRQATEDESGQMRERYKGAAAAPPHARGECWTGQRHDDAVISTHLQQFVTGGLMSVVQIIHFTRVFL